MKLRRALTPTRASRDSLNNAGRATSGHPAIHSKASVIRRISHRAAASSAARAACCHLTLPRTVSSHAQQCFSLRQHFASRSSSGAPSCADCSQARDPGTRRWPAGMPRQLGRRRRDSRGARQRESPDPARCSGRLPFGADHRKERTAPHLPGDGLAGRLSSVRALRGATPSAARIGGPAPDRRHHRWIRTGARFSADKRDRYRHRRRPTAFLAGIARPLSDRANRQASGRSFA